MRDAMGKDLVPYLKVCARALATQALVHGRLRWEPDLDGSWTHREASVGWILSCLEDGRVPAGRDREAILRDLDRGVDMLSSGEKAW